MSQKPAPPASRAPHVQAALARAAQAKLPARADSTRRPLGPAGKKWTAAPPPRVLQRAEAKVAKEEPKKQKILDLRPKVQGDPNPLSNYETWIPAIKNAAQYGVDKAPIVYVMNGWHSENPGTLYERLHFDISLDGSIKLHVYYDPGSNSVSIA
ncbi:MAG TPA: hypothetical protein VF756_06710 [Thermoanaerobaculia bacterium]